MVSAVGVREEEVVMGSEAVAMGSEAVALLPEEGVDAEGESGEVVVENNMGRSYLGWPCQCTKSTSKDLNI